MNGFSMLGGRPGLTMGLDKRRINGFGLFGGNPKLIVKIL